MSGGHLCEAEAPTEATAETSAPPEENETELNGYSQYIIYDNIVGTRAEGREKGVPSAHL